MSADEERIALFLDYENLAIGARENLGGMVFDFKQDQPVAMWMRNTRIPLDMLFIDRDGRVVNIHARAVPFDETSIHSDGPVRGVLELNGGTAARLGLKAGDVVRHAIFRNAVP